MSERLDHDELADIFLSVGALQPPSELHGYATGFIAAGGNPIAEEAWPQHCQDLLDCESLNPEQSAYLYRVYSEAKSELEGGELGLTLLLPGDEFELGQRIVSLGQWCQGFLTGFAMAGKLQLAERGSRAYSDDLTEALGDIAAIAQISADEDGEEQSEQDYFSVCEYVRVAAMTIHAECTSPAAAQQKGARLN
jgi:uncharacterized protein